MRSPHKWSQMLSVILSILCRVSKRVLHYIMMAASIRWFISPISLWCYCALLLFVVLLSLQDAQAFVAPSTYHRVLHSSSSHQSTRLCAATNNIDYKGEASPATHPLNHSDIEWRLCPPEGTSRINRWKIKLGANILRLSTNQLPPVLCPKGGRAMLEAYYKEPGKWRRRRKKIARFGFTTTRGPSSPESKFSVFC